MSPANVFSPVQCQRAVEYLLLVRHRPPVSKRSQLSTYVQTGHKLLYIDTVHYHYPIFIFAYVVGNAFRPIKLAQIIH